MTSRVSWPQQTGMRAGLWLNARATFMKFLVNKFRRGLFVAGSKYLRQDLWNFYLFFFSCLKTATWLSRWNVILENNKDTQISKDYQTQTHSPFSGGKTHFPALHPTSPHCQPCPVPVYLLITSSTWEAHSPLLSAMQASHFLRLDRPQARQDTSQPSCPEEGNRKRLDLESEASL